MSPLLCILSTLIIVWRQAIGEGAWVWMTVLYKLSEASRELRPHDCSISATMHHGDTVATRDGNGALRRSCEVDRSVRSSDRGMRGVIARSTRVVSFRRTD